MIGWKGRQAALAFTMLAALAALVFGKFGAGVDALLAMWTLAVVWLIMRLERKIGVQERDALLIRTLNRYRHDWMNDLQVLFGYIGLRKYDILPGYVDKIRAKASSESAIAKLGVPSLIVYLQSFRVDKRAIQLETEIEQDILLHMLPLDSRIVAELIESTVELFDRHAIELPEGEANMLSLQLDQEEEGLLLDFVYEGGYQPELKTACAAMLDRKARSAEKDMEFLDAKATVTVRIPFRSQGRRTQENQVE